MVGFYRKYTATFSKIAVPLTNLTRKNEEFRWSAECPEAFDTLKEKLTTAPILGRTELHRPFVLQTDASTIHVGAVLLQHCKDGSPVTIGYFSKRLKPAETRYSTTDKEALAIVLACRNFHHFL